MRKRLLKKVLSFFGGVILQLLMQKNWFLIHCTGIIWIVDVGVKKEEVVVDVVADDGDQENKKKTKATEEEEEGVKAENDACDNKKGIPNMDRLREELSCAVRGCNLINYFRFMWLLNILFIYLFLFFVFSPSLCCINLQICLEICFEPSTTPCGHRYIYGLN